jgi:hypothetical protein
MKLLSFWTLSMILFLFKIQHFGGWILSPKRVLNKNSMMDNVQKLNNCTCSIPNKAKTDTFSRLQSLGMSQHHNQKDCNLLDTNWHENINPKY